MEKSKIPITRGSEEGISIAMVGDSYRIVVEGPETNGEFATIDMWIPPGGGPGPHAHPDFQETFYVIEGELEVRSEAGVYQAKKGSYIVIPKGGIVHQFKNKSQKNAHILCTVIPSGLEQMFKELGKPIAPGHFEQPSLPDQETLRKMTEVAEKYGQKMFPPDYLEKQAQL